ncbi:unnamed protein product [Owenia fusiformis]|uniref:Major facilitator superfamily (MFS) profile domain-containing protein n=1 Tax=Owenia fusiformis TaxID=6347 RepID=A0A8S4NMP5_OWEFU|nr:unnamed protein product [Owenia fusiformis]
MGFDNLIPELGGFGRYQIFSLLTFMIFFGANGWQYSITVFIAGRMPHWCHVPELDHLNHSTFLHIAVPIEENQYGEAVYSQCRVYDFNYSSMGNITTEDVANWKPNGNISTRKCSGYIYDTSKFSSTLVSQYDLVCDRKWLYTLAASAFMAGLFCGAFFSGTLADRFGRQRTFSIMLILHLLSTLGAALVPNYVAFLVLRGLVGLSALGTYQTLWAYILEVIPKEARSKGFFILMLGRSSRGLLVLWAYFIRSHVHLQIMASLCLIPALIATFLLPESPRWLMATGRLKEAEKVCRRIARINGVKLPENFNINKFTEVEDKTVSDGNKKSATLFDLFRTPRLRKRTILSYCLWFSVVFFSYGLGLNIEKIIPGDIYLNMFLMMCVNEVGSLVIGYVALFKLKRRVVVSAWLIIAGVSVLAMAPVLLLNISGIVTALALIASVVVANLWTLVYLYAGELFPTVVRTIGIGSGSSVGRLGGLITPQLPLLGEIWYGLPYIVLGIVPVVVGVLVLCLPETKGQRLPDTLEEAEIFGTAEYDNRDYEMEALTSNDKRQGPLLNNNA